MRQTTFLGPDKRPVELDGPTSLQAHRSHTWVSQLAHRSMRQTHRLRFITLPSRMQRHLPVLSVAVGSGTHMMMEYDDTDTIAVMSETGATIQRVPD